MLRRRDESSTPTAEPTYTSTGVWPIVVVCLLVAAALVAFIAQNAHAVKLRWLWIDFRASPAVIVLITAVASVALAVAFGAAWRRRRRRILNEREELAQLRRTASAPPPPAPEPEPEPEPDVTLGSATASETEPSVEGQDEIDLRREAPPSMQT